LGGCCAIDKGGDAVDVLDVGIEGGVAANDAVEVSEFVEDSCEEVVFAGGCACGGAVGCGGEGLVEFGVVVGGGVDKPAKAVAVGVEGEGAGVWAIVGVVSGDGGFGELSGGEILDLYFEVKWCWGLKEFCPGGYCCVLEVGVMTAEELLERYAAGERDFSGVDLSGANLTQADLRDIDLSRANLSRVDLSWANLSEANLTEISLALWSSLSGANLSGANLTGANLNGCEMLGVNLENANTMGARLGSLESAFIRNTINPDGVLIEGPMTIE
jgi:Pentapeptide repeats (8 copies)